MLVNRSQSGSSMARLYHNCDVRLTGYANTAKRSRAPFSIQIRVGSTHIDFFTHTNHMTFDIVNKF